MILLDADPPLHSCTAVSLQYGFRTKHKLAGLFALSSYLNDDAAVYSRLEQECSSPPCAAGTAKGLPPVFMRHGEADGYIRPAWGRGTAEKLSDLGVDVTFDSIPNLQHSLDPREMEELRKWIFEQLAD